MYPEVRAAVRYAAERVPVAVCSGAFLEEIEPVVAAAGLAPYVTAIITADHVTARQAAPRGLPAHRRVARRAADGRSSPSKTPRQASPRLVPPALRVVGITRTLGPERLGAADELVERIDLALLERILA